MFNSKKVKINSEDKTLLSVVIAIIICLFVLAFRLVVTFLCFAGIIKLISLIGFFSFSWYYALIATGIWFLICMILPKKSDSKE